MFIVKYIGMYLLLGVVSLLIFAISVSAYLVIAGDLFTYTISKRDQEKAIFIMFGVDSLDNGYSMERDGVSRIEKFLNQMSNLSWNLLVFPILISHALVRLPETKQYIIDHRKERA